MKTKEGFKAVRRDRERLLSVWAGFWSSSIGWVESMAYERDIWSKRRKGQGPLAVFDSLKDAREFRITLNVPIWIVEIWRCEYVPSRAKTLWAKDIVCTVRKDAATLPDGTVTADRVKLLERVTL